MAALRLLTAIVMALGLTFAPLTAAGAAKAAHAGAGMTMALHNMPDCHMAKLHHGAPGKPPCCDHHSKSKCPDEGCGCALCGAQSMAVLAVQEPFQLAGASAFHTPEAAQPPSLCLDPQGPPPRV